MKRTSWITWRLYVMTLPINIIVLVLAADHELNSLRDLFIWSTIALFSHVAILPVIAIFVPLSQHFRNWRIDVVALIILGALRGAAIVLIAHWFDALITSSFWYKAFSSALALPLWFIALGTFIEARRNYQHEFQTLFSDAILKEQLINEKHSLLPLTDSGLEERVIRLQFLTSSLAIDLKKLVNRPHSLLELTNEAEKIQSFVHDEVRPTSRALWNKAKFSTPKVSLARIISISMFERSLRIPTVAIILSPYLFFGMMPSIGIRAASYLTLSIFIFNLSLFFLFEKFHSKKWLKQKDTNLLMLAFIFIIPYPASFFIDLDALNYNVPLETKIWLHLFSFVCFLLLLLMLNASNVISKQRRVVVESLQKFIDSDDLSHKISLSGKVEKELNFANYLHGEIQAGLTASTLLLQQANESGDVDLAKEALERASALLNQDHANIAFTRMARPLDRLQKIKNSWSGIADISIEMPDVEKLSDVVMRNMVRLIEEAVTNSVRHAGATKIRITGIQKNDLLVLDIFSNGVAMSKGKAGLGTKLFNELSNEWEYLSENGQNRITFKLINRI